MSNVGTLNAHTATIKRRPGRRKKLGTIDFSNGHLMWMVGYCQDCDGKVLADREFMESLKTAMSRTKKSLRYKILMALVRHYSE